MSPGNAPRTRTSTDSPAPWSRVFSAGDGAAIHRALDELEPAHREVLVLHFLEDFAVAEIAGIVKCPEGTVKSRLFHARRAMRALLERGGYGPTR